VGNNLRWDSLVDYTERDANLYAHCFMCNHTAIFSSHALMVLFQQRGWPTGMVTLYGKLVCSKCGTSAGKIGPSRHLPTVQPTARRKLDRPKTR